ncbi:MAG: hypothetical protein WCP32_03570 [Bacteroidota bacterium]
MKRSVIVLVFLLFQFLCNLTSSGQSTVQPNPTIHKVILREALQTTKYTYLKVSEDTILHWLAVPTVEFTIGDTLYYQGGLLMPDFKSKELGKTFDNVLFLEIVSKTQEGSKKQSTVTPDHGAKPKQSRLAITVEPAPDGITIAELFRNKEQYSGKEVRIRAQVSKFNTGIMGENWVHLQDGTSFGEKFDLTATTANSTIVIGDIVTIEGRITLNKDFGSGYFFEMIIEEAIFR